MKNNNMISDELLNAYVDGELSADDQAEVMDALRKNPSLSEQVCELRVLKEMLKVSYANRPIDNKTPESIALSSATKFTKSFSGLAASIVLFLAIGFAAFAGYQYANHGPSYTGQLIQLSPTAEQNQNILLHIGTDNDERIQLALDNAEHLLTSFAASDKKVQLQILVNAEGIHMLNSESSVYLSRIQDLSDKYENVAFLACQRSIERQKLKGVEIHLVKEANVIPEALKAVVNRLENGWVYIRA